MSRLWKWYQKCLRVHPIKTQVISSGVLWGLGDISAQSITHSAANSTRNVSVQIEPGVSLEANTLSLGMEDTEEEFKINWKRVATTSMFGFGFVGPVGHFWYEYLDRYIRLKLLMQPNSVRFVATKVVLDGLIFGPVDLLVFFSYMGFSAGKSASQVKEDLKRDFIPALILEGGAWPIMQVINFRYIPVRNQLLYVNALCLVDSAFLSWLEQQEDAAWKQWFKSLSSFNKRESQD